MTPRFDERRTGTDRRVAEADRSSFVPTVASDAEAQSEKIGVVDILAVHRWLSVFFAFDTHSLLCGSVHVGDTNCCPFDPSNQRT